MTKTLRRIGIAEKESAVVRQRRSAGLHEDDSSGSTFLIRSLSSYGGLTQYQ
jgi:hypothetical protein